MSEVLRYAAFTREPEGGNPAGVVLSAEGLTDGDMQRIAADVGYSETAFLTERPDGDHDIRYFSPLAEVPFCGHATIAAAVAHADRHGPGTLRLRTASGPVEVVSTLEEGVVTATLVSVPPSVREVDRADLDEALAALGWSVADLDPDLPPRIGFAGAHHLVLALRDRATLRQLDYDVDRLAALMAARSWTTLQLVHRTDALSYAARDPFPPGGVVEDPATGAAAAALGAYLRALGAVRPPATVTVRQGDDMGRPSVLLVGIPEGEQTPISVTGSAVALEPLT